jgi:rubredoxin
MPQPPTRKERRGGVVDLKHHTVAVVFPGPEGSDPSDRSLVVYLPDDIRAPFEVSVSELPDLPSEMVCPDCRVERADFEGPNQHLISCPNCGSKRYPILEGDEIEWLREALNEYPCTCVYDNYRKQMVRCPRCRVFAQTEEHKTA